MRFPTWILGVLVTVTVVSVTVVTAAWAVTDEPVAKPAEQYVLTRHSVYGVEPRQWVFILKTPGGEVGITTGDRLRQYVELMVPKNAVLEWRPDCAAIGGEPLQTAKELEAFAEFCGKRKIRFVVIPSG